MQPIANNSSKNPSKNIKRCFDIVELLAGHERVGLPNHTLATTLCVPATYTLRALTTLEDIEIVEQMDSKHWRLSPRMIGIAQKSKDSFVYAAIAIGGSDA